MGRLEWRMAGRPGLSRRPSPGVPSPAHAEGSSVFDSGDGGCRSHPGPTPGWGRTGSGLPSLRSTGSAPVGLLPRRTRQGRCGPALGARRLGEPSLRESDQSWRLDAWSDYRVERSASADSGWPRSLGWRGPRSRLPRCEPSAGHSRGRPEGPRGGHLIRCDHRLDRGPSSDTLDRIQEWSVMRSEHSSPRRGIHLLAETVAFGVAHSMCFFERHGGVRDGILGLPRCGSRRGRPCRPSRPSPKPGGERVEVRAQQPRSAESPIRGARPAAL